MNQAQTSHESILQLNGRPEIRTYIAEIQNAVTISGKVELTTVVLYFTLQYLGSTDQGNLIYKSIIQKRLFLDEKSRPVFEPSKAQKLALDIAKINDNLILEVSRNYKFIGIINTDEVQNKWQSVKNNIQDSSVDLHAMIDNFDRQIQTENIQDLFKHDVFYNFFFANLFYQEFDQEKTLLHEKMLNNGIHNLDVPILEKKTVTKEDSLLHNSTISITAELDIDNDLFPLAKINKFLGDVLDSNNDEGSLDFNYNGQYQVHTRTGIIDSGELHYGFEIDNLYSKNVTMKFNLEKNEQ